MHITKGFFSFLVFLIVNQIYLLGSNAKPFFTRVHRLNTVKDFDEVVDWTSGQNLKTQDQKLKDTQEVTKTPQTKRSLPSESPGLLPLFGKDVEKRMEVTTATPISTEKSNAASEGASDQYDISEMPSLPSDDERRDRKRSDVEEQEDVIDEDADSSEPFGVGLKSLYRKLKNKMRGSNLESCLKEVPLKREDSDEDYMGNVKYVLPLRRSTSSRYQNQYPAGYFGQSPGYLQPVGLLNRAPNFGASSSGADKRSTFYEVQWLQHSPVAPTYTRQRRDIDFPLEQTYSLMADRECNPNAHLTQSQYELMRMMRAAQPNR